VKPRPSWSADLAARIERGEADLIAGANAAARRRPGGDGFLIELAGGVASFAAEGSPFNKVVGLGFADVPDANALAEVERAYAERDAAVQVELAHVGDPRVGALLTERGYRLVSFEDVLGRPLTTGVEPLQVPGVEVRLSGDDEFDEWLEVIADGVAEPDQQGVPSHEEFSREAIKEAERDFAGAGATRYAALVDGVLAAGAGLRTADGVAQLTGAATVPAYRRRGAQSALLSARLADSVAAGCDVAVITTQPGSRSQENAQRRGFTLLYTRAILVKEPSGGARARHSER
jgi:ribosomal protein S18 acetylase RimI-like enzyme